jgi:hypothetical protein
VPQDGALPRRLRFQRGVHELLARVLIHNRPGKANGREGGGWGHEASGCAGCARLQMRRPCHRPPRRGGWPSRARHIHECSSAARGRERVSSRRQRGGFPSFGEQPRRGGHRALARGMDSSWQTCLNNAALFTILHVRESHLAT